mgnify:CR=1 FL=1
MFKSIVDNNLNIYKYYIYSILIRIILYAGINIGFQHI